MPRIRTVSVLLAAGTLVSVLARAGDPPRTPGPPDPDPGFLEFLGSVDNLADTNPDYMAQANVPHAPAPAVTPPVKSPPATGTTPAPGGTKNNE
ncbi:MAG: hypothetical protein JSS29_12635 [Proteobacteria bacterium]|nr:hypothetical protein [Pseudomonadota bacterium]